MRESRNIIIVSTILLIIVYPICFLFDKYVIALNDWNGIATNLFCGVIVGWVTSIIQYYSAKQKVINDVYSEYFDLYRTYYNSKHSTILGHYNVTTIYNKLKNVMPKVNEILSNYHGIIKEEDRIYRKLNPLIVLKEEYKGKNTLKLLWWFNKKRYENTIDPAMHEIEKVLISISEKKI